MISIIKLNSNLKTRNNQLSKKQLSIIEENNLPIPTFQPRTEETTLKCTKIKLNNTRKKQTKETSKKRPTRGILDGRTITTTLRKTPTGTTIQTDTRELKVTTTKKRTIMVLWMKRNKKKRLIYNIFKVRILNIRTKERRMSWELQVLGRMDHSQEFKLITHRIAIPEVGLFLSLKVVLNVDMILLSIRDNHKSINSCNLQRIKFQAWWRIKTLLQITKLQTIVTLRPSTTSRLHKKKIAVSNLKLSTSIT